MESETPLTHKERNELKRQEKIALKEATVQRRNMSKTIRLIAWSALGVAIVGGLGWWIASQPKTPESDIISRKGIHVHPQLSIYVKGEKQEFPANIGLGAVHQPIHTHADATKGILHLEMQGLVRKQDTVLGQFFRIWGKDFNSFGTNVTMTVNGKENIDLANYLMQDKDVIELHYE